MELCEVFQDKNKQTLGERAPAPKQEPLDVAGPASFKKTVPPRLSRIQLTSHPLMNCKSLTLSSWVDPCELRKQADPHSNPTTPPSVTQGHERKTQQIKKITNLTLTHAEQWNAAESSMSTSRSQSMSSHCSNQRRQEIPHQVSRVAKHSSAKQNPAGATTYVPKQDKQGSSRQSIVRRMTKLPTAGHVEEQRRGPSVDTLIRRQWSRRPGVGQRMAAVRGTTNDCMDTVMVTKTATRKEAAIGQYPYLRAEWTRNVSLSNKQEAGDYQPVYTHQKARDGQMTTMPSKTSQIVIMAMNEVKTGRRVAIQHGTNDNDISGVRRNGLCRQTDPAQRELTFIRVLRKRF